MKLFNNYIFPLVLLFWGCSSSTPTFHEYTEETTNYVIENSSCRLEVSRCGGMYTSFIIKDYPVNPFGWRLKPEQMPSNNQSVVFAGHFLCTGRWGSPSEGEIQAGIPHNGEVNTQPWTIWDWLTDQEGRTRVVMKCQAPLERLDVTRSINMPATGNYFVVRESFTNHLPIGRPVNFVQHGTISSPFLSSEMVVNTNAGYGFDQRTKIADIGHTYFEWPNAVLSSGKKIDLRKPKTQEGFVTSHIFPKTDTLGWISAYNPQSQLLLGYVFSTLDYPWFNYWYQSIGGQDYVRGLEFGTTGIGKPYQDLILEPSFFLDVPSYQYIDAGEIVSKWWLCFQIQVTANISGVEAITMDQSGLLVRVLMEDGTTRIIRVDLDQNLL